MFILAAIIFVINCIIIPILNHYNATVRNKLKELYNYPCIRTLCKMLCEPKTLLVHYCIYFLVYKYKDLPNGITLKIFLLYFVIVLSYFSIFSIVDKLNR